jgi:hypothetical protein
LQGKFERHRFFCSTAVLFTMAFVFSSALAQSMTPPVYCVSAAASALPVCDKVAELVIASGWADKRPGVSIAVEVLDNSATHLRVVLNLTAPDGRKTSIDRALSVSDTTMTASMQDRFLQKLVLALPPDF